MTDKTAYNFSPGTYDADLVEVEKGTPMGELMRRYWQPVGLSSWATDLPREVRVLGEDLILFRDKSGKAGLLYPRCAHRGTSLLYGRVEENGIRCCYHGWVFNTEGHCTEQPCEPNNGAAFRGKVRQPWYPVEERYGLIFAYMGPPEKKPLLPRYDALEDLEEGEQLFVDANNISSGRNFDGIVPTNWMQHIENIIDYAHFVWLHFYHSGSQFGSRFGELGNPDIPAYTYMPAYTWHIGERGIAGKRVEVLSDGRHLQSITEALLPIVRANPNPFGSPGRLDNVGFVLPVDSQNIRIFNVLRGKDDKFFRQIREARQAEEAKIAADPSYTQRHPNDWEAQSSQGNITLHSEEHLASTDRGVVMIRRLYRQQMEAVRKGGDPIGLVFTPEQQVIKLSAGQYMYDSAEEVPETVA